MLRTSAPLIGNVRRLEEKEKRALSIIADMSPANPAERNARAANCIAPGFIQTAMTDVLNDKQKTDISAMIPSQRFGTPMDIAAGCLYLASNEGGYITGQTLHINGGMAMV